ncbi:hypothetical protein [Prochlorococcus marinus]|uniref:hypothetical protein n=1 Tax=Prochlorococcus marinus TaxID=1219 RepID=UPI001ADBB1EB|nr:hypothetical protein [Prochlorococcus marinus]MBO8204884.1 hypothetical protein [Prochlorococcus marinus CUG1415]
MSVGGFLWMISKKIKKGEIVLSPEGEGNYFLGEVIKNFITPTEYGKIVVREIKHEYSGRNTL